MSGNLQRPQPGKTVPISLTFFVVSADMAVGPKKGKPNRFRVHPDRGNFIIDHVEFEHETSASVMIDVNKGAGAEAAITIYTNQDNRPKTSDEIRSDRTVPDITLVNIDDYFEIDIDVLTGTPGDMTLYIRGYKDISGR